MHWNEAGFEELRTVDSQYAFRPIDVFGLEPRRLTDAHAGHRQKSEDSRRVAKRMGRDAALLECGHLGGRADDQFLELVITRSGDVITICASRELRGPTPAFRTHVEKIIRAARDTNPAIKIELALIAMRSKAERAPMLKHAVDNIDLADRIAIYCDQDAESLESLKALLAGLRPEGA